MVDKNIVDKKLSEAILFKGMKIQQILEYIESKTLDSFYSEISKKNWDGAMRTLTNVKTFTQQFRDTIAQASEYFQDENRIRVAQIAEKLENTVQDMIKAITNYDYSGSFKVLEEILGTVREFYSLRE